MPNPEATLQSYYRIRNENVPPTVQLKPMEINIIGQGRPARALFTGVWYRHVPRLHVAQAFFSGCHKICISLFFFDKTTLKL